METKKAPQIPYGISDFVRMRTENYYYVDKTTLSSQPPFIRNTFVSRYKY
ncbi:MAG: AAA family ATPase [Phocaeicola vulgatus]